MNQFISIVKKNKNNLYIDIPKKIIKKMKLKPFMSAKIKATKKQIKIHDFKKTAKIKLNLDENTIKLAKKIMKIEGYGSLDETICNTITEFITKKKETQIVYLYPKEFLQGNFNLIDEYEKIVKTKPF
jgi:hypothetical protein